MLTASLYTPWRTQRQNQNSIFTYGKGPTMQVTVRRTTTIYWTLCHAAHVQGNSRDRWNPFVRHLTEYSSRVAQLVSGNGKWLSPVPLLISAAACVHRGEVSISNKRAKDATKPTAWRREGFIFHGISVHRAFASTRQTVVPSNRTPTEIDLVFFYYYFTLWWIIQ